MAGVAWWKRRRERGGGHRPRRPGDAPLPLPFRCGVGAAELEEVCRAARAPLFLRDSSSASVAWAQPLRQSPGHPSLRSRRIGCEPRPFRACEVEVHRAPSSQGHGVAVSRAESLFLGPPGCFRRCSGMEGAQAREGAEEGGRKPAAEPRRGHGQLGRLSRHGYFAGNES